MAFLRGFEAFAGERGSQKANGVPHPLVGLLERDAVPALDDHVARRAEPEHEATARQAINRCRSACQQCGMVELVVQDQRPDPQSGGRLGRDQMSAAVDEVIVATNELLEQVRMLTNLEAA